MSAVTKKDPLPSDECASCLHARWPRGRKASFLLYKCATTCSGSRSIEARYSASAPTASPMNASWKPITMCAATCFGLKIRALLSASSALPHWSFRRSSTPRSTSQLGHLAVQPWEDRLGMLDMNSVHRAVGASTRTPRGKCAYISACSSSMG
jgi:hypothetical protein